MRVFFLLSFLTLTLSTGSRSLALPGESSPTGASQGANSPADKSVAAGYPFVYRQVGYLATTGPAPMRFGASVPGGGDRTPPRITAAKKPELSRTAEGMARTEAIEAYRSIFGRGLPVPAGSPEGGPKVPDAFLDAGSGLGTGGANSEVLEFFQQPIPDADTRKRQNRFLFDPVFQAARPPAAPAAPAPQSRATYQN